MFHVKHLSNLVELGLTAEKAGEEDLAREFENGAYIIACKVFGDHWWYEHDMECLKWRATAVECWEMLQTKLEGETCDAQ